MSFVSKLFAESLRVPRVLCVKAFLRNPFVSFVPFVSKLFRCSQSSLRSLGTIATIASMAAIELMA